MKAVISICLLVLAHVAGAAGSATACGVATTVVAEPVVTTLAVPAVTVQSLAIQSFAVPSVVVPTVVAVPQVINQPVVVREVRRSRSATVVRVQGNRVVVRSR